MANFSFMNLPAAQAPRSALLDFAPLTESLAGFREGANAAQRNRDLTAIGQTAASKGYSEAGRQALAMGEVDAGLEFGRQGEAQRDRIVKRYGTLAQQVDLEQNPDRRSRMWAGTIERMRREGAKMGIAGEFDPEELDPATGPKLFMAQAGMVSDPLDRELKQAQINRANREAAGGQDFATREAAARAYGLDPNSDAGRAFILTGKMPREDQQALTATDKKAILEADEMVSINQGAINALDEAKKLSPQAYDGMLASQRAWLTNNLVPWATPQAEATSNLDNAVVGNALSQLKAIFGAAPTEGERKILLDLQGAANQPAPVREAIYARAKLAAEKRLTFNEDRARQLRGGTFYKPQTDTGPQPAPSGVGGAPLRARNKQTGEEIEWDGSQWVPVQ